MSEKMSAEELEEALREMPECASMMQHSLHSADLDAWAEGLQSAHRKLRSHIAALQREADGMRADAEFLLERLSQFEGDCEFNDETCREWGGHVIPAIERLRKALSPQEERS